MEQILLMSGEVLNARLEINQVSIRLILQFDIDCNVPDWVGTDG